MLSCQWAHVRLVSTIFTFVFLYFYIQLLLIFPLILTYANCSIMFAKYLSSLSHFCICLLILNGLFICFNTVEWRNIPNFLFEFNIECAFLLFNRHLSSFKVTSIIQWAISMLQCFLFISNNSFADLSKLVIK